MRSPDLSKREVEVVSLIAKGMRNREVAAELCLSEETIKSHVRTILMKTGAKNRTNAIVVCYQRGILPSLPSSLAS